LNILRAGRARICNGRFEDIEEERCLPEVLEGDRCVIFEDDCCLLLRDFERERSVLFEDLEQDRSLFLGDFEGESCVTCVDLEQDRCVFLEDLEGERCDPLEDLEQDLCASFKVLERERCFLEQDRCVFLEDLERERCVFSEDLAGECCICRCDEHALISFESAFASDSIEQCLESFLHDFFS
jgi:hypothetical protein